MKNIVIISESSELKMLCNKIRTFGYSVNSCSNWAQIKKCKYRTVDVLFFDIENYAKKEIAFSLEVLKQRFNTSSVFICCSKKSEKIEEVIVEWGFTGVIYFFEPAASINKKIQKAIYVSTMLKTKDDVKIAFPSELKYFVGMSPQSLAIKKHLCRLATLDVPVLLLGETGCGKTLCAKILQKISKRNTAVFIHANMARFSPSLCESELFGSCYGAFTGAIEKCGLFEKVDGGTLFLDEIGTLSLQVQTKMLRVLDEGKFSRVGETKERKVDVRLISATNLSKEELHNDTIMRQDFFYRIAGDVIEIPPLRKHREDIPLLIMYFCKQLHIDKNLSMDSVKKLMKYDWHGNVRELRTILQKANASSDGKCILSSDICFI